MKKKWLVIFISIVVFVCAVPKVIDYTEFKNNQEALFNWAQSFSSEDVEYMTATIFRENTAPEQYTFRVDEIESLLNILKAVPKESFLPVHSKSPDGISVYICRWKFDETGKNDLLLKYKRDGITVLGFTSEVKNELFTGTDIVNWAIDGDALSEFMERYLLLLEADN